MNIDDCNTLWDYALTDSSEIGDYVCSLLSVRYYSIPHGMTEEFNEALNKELEYWLIKYNTEFYIDEYYEKQPDKLVRELKEKENV